MRNAPRALIAGLGLIGGSIGMALRARGWHVAYNDPNVDLHDAKRAGAADDRPALQHQHAQAGSRQVARARQPVVPPADDDRVVVVTGHSA